MHLLEIYKIKCVLDKFIFLHYLSYSKNKSTVTEGCAMSNTYSCDKCVCLIPLSNLYFKVPCLFQLINNTQHYLIQHTYKRREASSIKNCLGW